MTDPISRLTALTAAILVVLLLSGPVLGQGQLPTKHGFQSLGKGMSHWGSYQDAQTSNRLGTGTQMPNSNTSPAGNSSASLEGHDLPAIERF